MTEDIRAYIDSLECVDPKSREEWLKIIEAEQDDFESQDERFTRLTEQELNAIIETLYNDGYVIPSLTAPGWKIPEDAELNSDGNIEFLDGDTKWEVDPDTGASRHCGTEPGSFWSEWETC